MELADLYTVDAHNAGAEMRVKDQAGKPTDIYIRVVGLDSSIWRNTLREAQRAAVERLVSGEAEVEQDNTLTLAKATIGWRGLTRDGAEVEFTQEEAQALYKNAPYIADQIDRFIAKRANFTQS